MALTGPDGESLSHLGRRFGAPEVTTPASKDAASSPGMPSAGVPSAPLSVPPARAFKGRWVGPKNPDERARMAPIPDPPGSEPPPPTTDTWQHLPAAKIPADIAAGRRREAAVALKLLLDVAELTPEQRETLTHAMFVVAQL